MDLGHISQGMKRWASEVKPLFEKVLSQYISPVEIHLREMSLSGRPEIYFLIEGLEPVKDLIRKSTNLISSEHVQSRLAEFRLLERTKEGKEALINLTITGSAMHFYSISHIISLSFSVYIRLRDTLCSSLYHFWDPETLLPDLQDFKCSQKSLIGDGGHEYEFSHFLSRLPFFPKQARDFFLMFLDSSLSSGAEVYKALTKAGVQYSFLLPDISGLHAVAILTFSEYK
ncbi:MAG: hypothetical protein QW328_07830 [Nitrososphaerota archaeon]